MSISKADLLQQVKNRQISPEQALKLYRALEHSRSVDLSAPEDATTTPPTVQTPSAVNTADIAIIGLSGQMPGAANIQQMWEQLCAGRDTVTDIPAERWGQTQDAKQKRWGAFLSDVDCFDPLFFEISPKEAEQMDPQQRLLLQESWKAFEDAGYSADSLKHSACCVFIGCTQGDYLSNTSQQEINPLSLTGRSVSAMAARISYIFNLRGPSLTINTACSSSLTALVMACDHLRAGRSDMGLVGGISLMSTATAHATMQQVGMISSEGKCRTFDQAAQGIVPGEAVGIVVIKRLADALRDGDHIYGVLRGYGINHDGKTNGLTAPSGPAQTALLLDIYRQFQLDPNRISYIEAHGTGTKLGDPIEVNALTDAFAQYKVGPQQCALGSLKTNIGHTLEAAGIMGLLKVLLCLQHQQLVPSLHFQQPNEHIAFADSPFYVNTEHRAWPRIDGQPLQAGVSSFGMSGTNAHVVVEEAPATYRSLQPLAGPFLLPISAKTPEALAQRIKDLQQWVAAQDVSRVSLAEVAYTLQIGRSHFAYRQALVVQDWADCMQQLQALAQENKPVAEILAPTDPLLKQAKQTADTQLRRWSQVERDVTQDQTCLRALAACYCVGVAINWLALCPQAALQRLSLPTYPFAKQRYWLHGNAQSVQNHALHPLLHENCSDVDGLCYRTRFSGAEFFLADHQLLQADHNAIKVLPGVLYLELARVATQAAFGLSPHQAIPLTVSDVAWVQPIYVTETCEVYLRLAVADEDSVHFTVAQAIEQGERIDACGTVSLSAPAAPPRLDLTALRQQMPQSFTAETCYQRIRAEGIAHGERLQALHSVQVGDGQVLAKLLLPEALGEQAVDYVLQPSLLDAAIQAAIALVMGTAQAANPPSLPFALEALTLFAPLGSELFAWLRYAPNCGPSDAVQKLDIDLCNMQGQVCLTLRGLSSRVLVDATEDAVEGASDGLPSSAHPTLTHSTDDVADELPLYAITPVWNPIPESTLATVSHDRNSRLLLIGGTAEQHTVLQQQYPNAQPFAVSPDSDIADISAQLQAAQWDELVWITPSSDHAEHWHPDAQMIQAQQAGVFFLFRVIKALLAAGYEGQDLTWTLLTFRTQAMSPSEHSEPTHASIHGLVGSLAQEYPHWQIRLIDLDSPTATTWPLTQLFSLPFAEQGKALAYRQQPAHADCGAEWFQQALIRVHPLPELTEMGPVYRQGGVYVVIGGAGGIGAVWSRYVSEQYQAKVIWLGRREPDAHIQQQLAAMPDDADVTYLAVDARNPAALQQAYETIKQRYPDIHGVVHSAIVLNDLSLARMEQATFAQSLSAKVDISVNIAQVFRKERLDFVLFFSSMQAFARAPGQSNYAAGCTFKDAFALQLAKQWPYRFSNGSSHHKPVVKVINWGYWGSIGIVNDARYRQRRNAAGDGSIEPQEGMAVLSQLMAMPLLQLAPFKALSPEVVSAACGEEDIAAYSESLPAVLKTVQSRFAEELAHLPHARADWQTLQRESQNALLDSLLLRLLGATLRQLGLEQTQRNLPGYMQRWLQESRRVLSLTPTDTTERLTDLWAEWEQAKADWLHNPNLKPAIILVETCVRALPEILTGQVAATDVMFPNASMELVEGIYRGNIVSDYFQQALADFLVLAIEERLRISAEQGEPMPKLRLLEIGAGTGGTTATILPCLKPYAEHIAEYCYTDLSKAFLLHAETHYAPDNPFLVTRLFDIGQPLAKQPEIQADHYDFVIAANVLHATNNIRTTLRNAKATLRTNGILLLNELSLHSLLSHLTFGLLEGWWLYEDEALRILGSPGLYPEAWEAVLTAEGFNSVGLPVAQARELGLQIISAQSDGIVRQTRPPLLDSLTATAATSAPLESMPAVEAELEPESEPLTTNIDETLLREKATEFLKQRVAATLKMQARQIDANKPLEIYGIDSILVVQLASDLRKDFSNISNTLFFEVQTIAALVEHFLDTQRDTLIQKLGLTPSVAPVPQHAKTSAAAATATTRPATQAQAHTPAATQGQVFDVAIVGLSGRYPQADTVAELWQHLSSGRNCVSEIPADRWDWQTYYDPKPGTSGKSYTRWGGFLTDVDCFDPLFFHIAPRDAEQIDPQERLFLQCAYAALQDAGYTPANFGGTDRNTGVFVGVMNSSYRGKPGYFSIANRISYQFNFQGPSMAIDTACSASLTALHVALESMYCGSCQRAIVGGVNLILHPSHYTGLTELGMLSANAECKSFGDGADGFIAAEGVGAVLLKPLSQAVADQDHIYAVVKASAVNAGGKTNGYTVPNPNAQAAMIEQALRKAGIAAADLSYIEAHGTGTALGDPIEINALNKALQSDPPQQCKVGSIKSNIGHCESAAGIAGLTKILLQLQHGQIAPSLHSETLNPAIDFANTPFTVPQQLTEWTRPQRRLQGRLVEIPRTAGLSSFGAGGANAHIILQEYQPTAAAKRTAPAITQPVIVPFSAGSVAQLRTVLNLILQQLQHTTEDSSAHGFNLRNLAYTLQVGREALPVRLGCLAASLTELAQQLTAVLALPDLSQAQQVDGVYCSPSAAEREAVNLLTADEDTQTLLASWLSKQKYGKVLEAWVLGLELDWQQLYSNATPPRPYRLALPSYPFLTERYWYADGASVTPIPLNAPTAQPTSTPAIPMQADPGICFVAKWQAAPLSASAATNSAQRVLIVTTVKDQTWPPAIAARHATAESIVLRLGSTTEMIAPNEWYCAAQDSTSFATCLQGVGEIDCVYFLALPTTAAAPFSLAQIADSAEQYELPLLRLVKYLSQHNTMQHTLDFYLLTLANYSVAQTPVQTGGGGVTGLGYAIAQGNHRFAVRNLDLTPAEVAHPAQLLPQIQREPANSQGEVIKLQHGQRYRQQFVPLDWPSQWPNQTRSVIRQRGVYLIVGGSGTIGQVVTRHLIEQYQAQVIWIGRSAPTADAVQQALAQFAACSPQPHYLQADVTELATLHAAVQQIKADYGRLHGAIYSALVFAADNTVDNTTEALFRQILTVKTQGSANLYQALADEPLDFLCYFSSGQAYAFSGAAKHAAYACGITFADNLAQVLQTQARFPVGTINWGFWQASLTAAKVTHQHIACLSDAEGCACLEHFLVALQHSAMSEADGLTQALCLRPSPSVLALMNVDAGSPSLTATTTMPTALDGLSSAAHPTKTTKTAFIHSQLRQCFAETLKAPEEKIESKRAFADYGLDSILGVRFVNLLNERLQIRLNTAIIFEYASLDRLAEYVLQQHGDSIAAAMPVPPQTVASPAMAAPMPSMQAHTTAALATTEIAIIGMSGQFPKAENVKAFWHNLVNSIDGVQEYPSDYLSPDAYSPEKQAGKSYCKWGGILAQRDCFDPQFFTLSPREAHSMNVHQRLVMQEGWKALEDAGYNPSALSGTKTSVFIGAEPTGYFHNSFTGASDALIASRLSYHLNFSGPALVVNTGCSSSAVAIHLACESLRNGESDLALAGGVNACMNQAALVNLSAAEMLSPSGTCATFDAAADGTLISEGIGIVVLKRLADAIADGDSIDGVICASGINQDGASNGITAPNGTAQAQLIDSVYRKFNIDPNAISYMEAHGTGTKLGDPVEANALSRAFKRFTQQQSYCAVGSAKSHIGHTSAAAGVIGLIKVLLSMRHEQLPPLLHFKQLNPLIEFAQSPFYINDRLTPWPAQADQARMAALNSFGHSGTNAHIVIRDHPAPLQTSRTVSTAHLLPFSAKNAERLSALLQHYAEFLAQAEGQSLDLAAFAYTVQTGREAMRQRVVFLAENVSELQQQITAFLRGATVAQCWQGHVTQSSGALTPLPIQASRAQLADIAHAWCQGQTIDWAAGHLAASRRRLHLPSYPFAQQRYGKTISAEPAPVTLPEVGNELSRQLREQLYAQREALQNPRMEQLLFDLLWTTLQAVELLQPAADGAFTLPTMAAFAAQQGRSLPAFYQQWLDESLASLRERGYLTQDAHGRYWPQQPLNNDLSTLWHKWDQEKVAWLANPQQQAQVQLIEACLRGLPQILRGQVLATDIMFPDGSLELVAGVYQNNLISDYFNAVLGDVLFHAIQTRLQQDPGAQVHILEIGAGTGGTTRGLLQRLQAVHGAIADYRYTDLSKAFLNHAKRNFAPGNPFLSTQILDIDQPLAAQGIAAGQFDFVIATNVLHATGNIQRTLDHAQSALAGNGLLLINEMSDKSLFVHLTFGLLEGWWLYDDPELRVPGIPGLYPERWAEVLSGLGFAQVQFPAQAEHRFGQQVIVAQQAASVAPVITAPSITVPFAETAPPMTAFEATPTTTTALTDFITEALTDALAEALQMAVSDIALDEAFADYGLDSLLGIQFIRDVNKRLQIDLETVVIFDYNTVLKLSAYVAEQYQAQLQPLLATVAVKPAPLSANTTAPAPMPRAPLTPATHSTALVQEPIAIVGMSGRFAQSSDLTELWDNLAAAKDQVGPATRWDLTQFFSAETLANPQFCTDGGFMKAEDVSRFDPLFFKISGTEATYMDPQQRVFLETAWSALEDAGYAVEEVDGKPYGVFLGYGGSDYAQLFDNDTAPAQAFWGNSASIIPARIAYYLNITGPAITVDTACSGSLVAIHQACQTLWTREIELALAGGVSLMCTPTFYQTGTNAGMLSSTGRCHSFDAQADGFIPGEGVGVLALKRLSDALAAGDHIHGVIRGTALNQDGNTNGITAPSAKSQERLERLVYERFNINPASIQMMEAHGTGTKLGDPIEFSALTRAFRASTEQTEFCALSSIKTNIGHVGPAAGVAGLCKILLSLKYQKMPASLHFQQANPAIRVADSPFFINTELRDWPAQTEPRRAAISSFGFSGTNAHMVIEEAPPSTRQHAIRPAYLIALSARTAEQLQQHAANLLRHCEQESVRGCPPDLGNLSYTLLCKRKAFAHRLVCTVESLAQLQTGLSQWLAGQMPRQICVTALADGQQREQAALKRYGNECLSQAQQTQDAAQYREYLDTVADLFSQGYRFNFAALFDAGYQTLSLPTYPFAREQYWVAPAVLAKSTQVSSAITTVPPTPATIPPVTSNAVKNWLFLEDAWQNAPLDDLDWSACLQHYAGKVVWAVYSSPEDEAAMRQLLTQVQAVAQLTQPLQLHLIAADTITAKNLPPEPAVVLFLGAMPALHATAQHEADAVAAVYRLTQALMLTAWETPIQLFYLYQQRSDQARLDCQALTGLLGTAMMENPQHCWTLLEYNDPIPELSGLQLLVQEWLAAGPAAHRQHYARWQATEGGTVFRNQHWPQIRYQQANRQLRVRQQTDFNHNAPPAFHPGKTYLLIGGFGLIGTELCRELAKQYQPTLVILARRDCDAARQAHCAHLTQLGATVHYYAVDVTDPAALTRTYTDIKQTVGPIHGVIQLGNTAEGGLIAAKDYAAFVDKNRVKVQGTQLIDEITAAEPLDFFLLFSSIGAFGIRGSSGYSYACAYLNAFAATRNRLRQSGQRSGQTVSIGWGPWTSDPIHASGDPNRAAKIRGDGFDFIDVQAALPLLIQAPAQAQDWIGIWAMHDVAKASRYMDVQLTKKPLATELASNWTAKIQAWEQQAQQGQAVSVETIAAEMDLTQLAQLDPNLIQRVHRLLFAEESATTATVTPVTTPIEPVEQPTTPTVPPVIEAEPAPAVTTNTLTYFKTVIKTTASELLKLQDMDEQEMFQNYGMDSVFGVQLAIRLEKQLGVEVEPKWLIDYPSIATLSAHLITQQQQVA